MPQILRHTYATTLFAQGIDLKTVSYLLGHFSIQVTADYYIHAQRYHFGSITLYPWLFSTLSLRLPSVGRKYPKPFQVHQLISAGS
ncbi:tyrosine-type recombinase/integrase [Eubacterium pyruvativorans]|uniref:tyrosine-type recombinase/integrase n=1 Tax=Eubacterium pyruvativorans TaxID=155865 RepID=UPI000B878235|nr:tyrosine-type recombinase/integrase [Eubacterium pyruvativorans]